MRFLDTLLSRHSALSLRRLRGLALWVAAAVLGLGLLLSAPQLAAVVPESALETESRDFSFTYQLDIPADPDRTEPMRLFVPIAVDDDVQKVRSLKVDAAVEGEIRTESEYGNRYWTAMIPPNPEAPVAIKFRYSLSRDTVRAGTRAVKGEEPSAFLGANERVAVSHPVLEPILLEVREASANASPAARARAIFDWVVANVEYKKVGSGWGNGDTFWACNERYGNCTDFHSLFISLARTEGIPARFQMGFPIPLDRSAGKISGYHCWVEFWLPSIGWFPIDASEAFKNPEKRDLFYGTHPADRLHFSTGRDIRLGEEHQGRPLNYFVYPYAEIAGQRSDVKIETEFSYREAGAEGEAGRATRRVD